MTVTACNAPVPASVLEFQGCGRQSVSESGTGTGTRTGSTRAIVAIVGCSIIGSLLGCTSSTSGATNGRESAGFFSWSARVDREGRSAGIYTTTPFPIDETTGAYTIRNDEHPAGQDYTVGTVVFVDNGAQATASCADPDETYDPSTRGCGSGGFEVYATVSSAVAAQTAGNRAILVREGTYSEPSGISMSAKTGLSDTQRFSIVGYRQERPIIDGAGGTSVLFGRTGAAKAYVTYQRLKLQNNAEECIGVGAETGGEDADVHIIDVEAENCMDKTHTDAPLLVYHADDAWIFHSTIHRTYGHGIKVSDGSSNSIIEWSDIHEVCWWPGISETSWFGHHCIGLDIVSHCNPYSGRGNVARYNIIHDTFGNGINLETQADFEVHHNEIYNTWRCADICTDTLNDCYQHMSGYSNMHIGGGNVADCSHYGRVYGNILRDPHGNPDDGILGFVTIAAPTTETAGISIYNNLMYGAGITNGITLFSTIGYPINLYNNSVYVDSTTSSPRVIWDQAGNLFTMVNNIFVLDGSGTIYQGTPKRYEYNVFYAPSGSAGLTVNGSNLDQDPGWVLSPSGAYTDDYARLSASLAGTDLSTLFNEDANGTIRTSWDRGYLEFVR